MTAGRPRTVLRRLPLPLALLATAAFAALSLNFDAATRFYAWPWFFYWQVLLVAPIAVLAGRLLAGRPWARFGGALDAGCGLLAAAAVGSAWFSPFRWQSLNAALTPVAAVALAYLLLGWIEGDPAARSRRATRLGLLVGGLMLLFVAISYAMWVGYDILPARAAGWSWAAALGVRNENPLGHSVYTAGFAVLAAPWLATLGLAASRRRERGLWLGGALLAAALVPTTSSRGGVIALLAALGCAAALWLARPGTPRSRLLLAAGGLGLAAVLFAGLNPRLRDFLRQGRWSAVAGESNQQRVAMLDAGWLMGRDRPWSGYGPSTVPLVYPRYRAELPGGAEDVLQLHDTPIQFWAELGAPGLLALLLLLAGGLARAFRPHAAAGAAPPAGGLAAGAFAALTGYAVMALTDFQLDVPLMAAVVVALAVLWQVHRRPAAAGSPRAARLLGSLLLAALALMLWPTVSNLRARQRFAAAADARLAGRRDAFVRGTEQAGALAPHESFYPVQLGAFYGEQYLHADAPAAQAADRERCAAAWRRALAINPDQEYCHFNLGWLLWLTDPAAADPHFRAAARLVPDKGGVYLGLGLSLLARDRRGAAVEALALEWLNDPQAMTSPLWTTPPLAAMRGDVAAAAHRQIARWLEAPALPDAVRRRLRYTAALLDWWLTGRGDAAVLERDGTAGQRRFFAALPAIEQRAFVPPAGAHDPWIGLYAAWRDGTPLRGGALAAAVSRRLARDRDSFVRALTAPPADEDALVQITRNERLGYSVLMRNQDGFLLKDLYIFPENRLVLNYASFLFPPKGYLPASLLLARLNDPALAPR
jgi:O-antigen ligase